MRDDFAAFILTHGRPDNQRTLRTLAASNYTGRWYLVVDDEDVTLPEYLERYGAERVLTFNKPAIAATFDEGDNFGDRRAIIYARNACFQLAKQIDVRYFIELDDDYNWLGHRMTPDNEMSSPCPRVLDADKAFEALVQFLIDVPYLSTVAFAQGGDFIGGTPPKRALPRKAMNTFVCDTQRPFQFRGRINEDVNTYTEQARAGLLLLTYPRIYIDQSDTQSSAGGMTDLYLASGTYVKSFYTVMYAPSCATINMMGGGRALRLHHRVDWNAAAPRILSESVRK